MSTWAAYEDEWLVSRLEALPGANMAEPEFEKRFVVRDEWHDRPLGYQLSEKSEQPANDTM